MDADTLIAHYDGFVSYCFVFHRKNNKLSVKVGENQKDFYLDLQLMKDIFSLAQKASPLTSDCVETGSNAKHWFEWNRKKLMSTLLDMKMADIKKAIHI